MYFVSMRLKETVAFFALAYAKRGDTTPPPPKKRNNVARGTPSPVAVVVYTVFSPSGKGTDDDDDAPNWHVLGDRAGK